MFRLRYARSMRLRVLRDAPVDDPGAGGTEGGSGGTPPEQPAPPAPFDPNSLSPEAKAWADAQIRAADQKARTTSKENAAKEARAKLIAELTGGDPEKVDPAELARQLKAQAEENRQLKAGKALGDACRKLGGDEPLVLAVLAHEGKLASLDPGSAAFAADVEAAVKAAIDANPKLKAAVAPPAGGKGAGAGAMNGGSGEGKGERKSDLTSAIAATYSK